MHSWLICFFGIERERETKESSEGFGILPCISSRQKRYKKV